MTRLWTIPALSELFCTINTPSIKWQCQWQGPIGIYHDAPKSVPDPFKSVNQSVKTP